MDYNLIQNAKNSVGPGFGPGADNPISLHTLETSVYRVTGMNQIKDIIDCGYVRPKGYGSRADRVGDKLYWSQGGSKLYYHDKRPVIEAPTDKVKDGQIGAISINNLSAIWMFDEQQNKYVNRLERIKQLHNQKQQELASQPTTVTLEQLAPILSESGYLCVGHGTGRSGNSDGVVDSIFQRGLRTKNNSLYFTSIVLSTPTTELIKQYEENGMPKPTIETLKQQLNNWQHQDSKKVILARIPMEYINMMGDRSDLDGEMFGAFMNTQVQEDGTPKFYLDSRFILGCYDVDTQTVRLNKTYERTLSKRTIRQLKDGYARAVAKTKKRIEATTLFPNVAPTNENLQPQQETSFALPDFDFDDQIDWGLDESDKLKHR